MKLSDDELKKLPSKCMPFNSVGAVIINKEILSELVKELIELRKENREEEENENH